ncbi:hypothetical protein [Microcoleus sp. F10-A1]|uniref:hypothetical protein n=1 Tax=Microcoleus sp. F10-A1 TaxID=2818750 RepID=UPI002FCE8037
MKKFITLLSLLIVTKTSICQSQHFLYEDKFVSVNYYGEIKGDILYADLTLTDLTANKPYKFSTITIDIKEDNYRLKISEKLIEKAKEISATYGEQISDELLRHFVEANTQTADKYGNLLKPDELKREEAQGFFYFNTVFNIISRYRTSLSKGMGTYECSTYNGYIVGLTPYYAKEDLFVDIKNFREYLNEGQFRVVEETAEFMIEQLNENPELKNDFKSIELFFDNLFKNNPEKLRFSGSSCGCCGNYSGTCWFASVNCLVHDFMCQTCRPRWFCFSGCVPSRC